MWFIIEGFGLRAQCKCSTEDSRQTNSRFDTAIEWKCRRVLDESCAAPKELQIYEQRNLRKWKEEKIAARKIKSIISCCRCKIEISRRKKKQHNDAPTSDAIGQLEISFACELRREGEKLCCGNFQELVPEMSSSSNYRLIREMQLSLFSLVTRWLLLWWCKT